MAKLTGQTIADSYDQLLIVGDANGITSTAQAVESADTGGNSSLLYLSTTEVYSPGKAGTSNTVFGKASGAALASGANYNVFLGEDAGNDVSTGDDNVFLGYLAGDKTTAASKAVIIGSNSGGGVLTAGDGDGTGADGTIAIGYESLEACASGSGNVAIGQQSLSVEDDGDFNTAVGFQSLQQQTGTTGTIGNTGLGYRAGRSLTTATKSTLVGYQAGGGATMTGQGNTLMGYDAGYAIAGGADNVAIGRNAMDAAAACNYNVGVGVNALGTADSGEEFNIAIGYDAMVSVDDTNADHNVVLGAYAGTGGGGQFARNIAIGSYSLNSTGSSELTATIGIGYETGTDINHADASGTVMVGHQAGAQITSGQYNVLIGQQSGNQGANGITTGDYNTAVGTKTLGASAASNITGNGNVAGGYEALLESEGAVNNNTAVGFKAGQNITTAEHNTAVGTTALQTLVTGNSNTMIGSSAGTALPAGAEQNTAVGREALAAGNSSDTDNNVCVGYRAGYQIQAGSGNTLIGTGVDVNTSNYTNSTGIGYNFETTSSNAVFLGNGSVTKVYMSVDGDGEMYANGTINTSDIRFKKNVEDTDLGLGFINKLRPVKYDYKKDKGDGKKRYGIIAQEVLEVLKDSGNEDFAGIKTKDLDKLGADYIQFITPLIKAVQELSAKVEELESKLK